MKREDRTLIISDVHGNRWALDAVLAHARKNYQFTELWCLGDVVGSAPWPFETWRLLRSKPIPPGGWVAGNHDWGLIGLLEGPMLMMPDPENGQNGHRVSHFREIAWKIIEIQRDVLQNKQEMLAHLQSLPALSLPRMEACLTHGSFLDEPRKCVSRYSGNPTLSPQELWESIHQMVSNYPEYVYKPAEQPLAPQIFVVGHTHKARVWRWEPTARQWKMEEKDAQSAQFEFGNLEQQPIFLNPGTASAFRDGSGCPSYMLLDWEKRMIYYHRVSYNYEATRNAMQELPLYCDLANETGFLIDPKCPE